MMETKAWTTQVSFAGMRVRRYCMIRALDYLTTPPSRNGGKSAERDVTEKTSGQRSKAKQERDFLACTFYTRVATRNSSQSKSTQEQAMDYHCDLSSKGSHTSLSLWWGFYLILASLASIFPCHSFPGTSPAISFASTKQNLGIWADLRNCQTVQKKKKSWLLAGFLSPFPASFSLPTVRYSSIMRLGFYFNPHPAVFTGCRCSGHGNEKREFIQATNPHKAFSQFTFTLQSRAMDSHENSREKQASPIPTTLGSPASA